MSKTVLITGASRGIGKACALHFAKNGYSVAVVYKENKERAENAVAEIRSLGVGAESYAVDAGDYIEVKRVCESVVRRFGRIDVLVNNCGISEYALFQDITPQMWSNNLRVNLDSVYNFTNCIVPSMLSRKQGSIVNVSSMWGLVGAAVESHYSAAKAAVIGLTKALAKELCYSGVRVNCVAPGMTATDMMKNSFSPEQLKDIEKECPMGRMILPEEIAEGIFFLAQTECVTGSVLNMSGGMAID